VYLVLTPWHDAGVAVTTEVLRFPLTLWPGTVVPVPAVDRFADVAVDPGGYLRWEDPVEQVEIPDELFLRELFGVDTASEADVQDFLRSYGVLARRFTGLVPVSGTPDPPPASEQSAPPSNHWRDASLYLKTARALTRHWLAVVGETDLGAAWHAEAWSAEGFGVHIPTKGGLWDWFVRSMNQGLKAFTVRVEIPVNLKATDFSSTLGVPRPDLYSALCLQLANHIAEGATVRRCQNETCSDMFVRQQGGARHGQYRTVGVMYCSTYCGNAQWQREHRRKKRSQERGQ
jgi:hypothetical protein